MVRVIKGYAKKPRRYGRGVDGALEVSTMPIEQERTMIESEAVTAGAVRQSVGELTQERLKEIREHKDRAFDMVSALCKPRGTEGSREWIMSIPARPDHDPDLVIGAALEDIDALLAHIAAQAEEIERLRKEREVLAEAVMGWQRYLERDVGTERVHVRTLEAHGRAIALLDGEKGGNVNPLAAYTDGQLYDELHRRGWVAATWPTKGGVGRE